MKKYLLLTGLIFLSVSCGRVPEIAFSPETNERTAGVLKSGDTEGLFYLTDYFPALEGVDSLTASPGLTVVAQDGDWRTFRLSSDGMEGTLGWLSVWKQGEKAEIVVDASAIDSPAPQPRLYTLASTPSSVTIGFTEPPEQVVALWQNVLLDEKYITPGDGSLTVRLPRNIGSPERSYLRVYASAGGQTFSDILVPLEKGRPVTSVDQLNRHDPHTQIIYSLMIDRFYNGNKANDWKINSPEVLPQVDYQGGDIRGITEKIRQGYFTDLGITTIWISPITQNPYDAWGLNLDPRTKFSGYHGYWPIYTTVIDPRFGTDEELREMLSAAHERGINVILDYVANHLHINSPVLKAHPDWTTPLELPDGRKNLGLWDEYRLTTWFDTHIPTLDMEREEVYQPMTDSALFWIANFDFDGFRHDATKHIPEVFWRTLTAKMRERFPDRNLYQIGETYGSPELIGRYVKSGMLDGQFDFNVYDRSIWNLASDKGSMKSIAEILDESLRFYGSHHLMGNITGNHDRPRFISLAGGALAFDEDHKAAGWKRDVTVGDPAGYDRLMLLEALMMTIPGVPTVYQGDEYGVPGGNDPDNRRMMQFGGYSPQQQRVLDNLKQLTALRRGSLPLLYGDMIPLYSDASLLVFARIYMGEPVVVILNRDDQSRTATVAPPPGTDFDSIVPKMGNGTIRHDKNRNVTLTVGPRSFEILTRSR